VQKRCHLHQPDWPIAVCGLNEPMQTCINIVFDERKWLNTVQASQSNTPEEGNNHDDKIFHAQGIVAAGKGWIKI